MIYDLIREGGPMMWPIVGLSVLGTMIILERVFFWLRYAMNRDAARRRALTRDGVTPTEADLEEDDPVVRLAGLARLAPARAPWAAEKLGTEGRRGLGALELLATISTTLGLFGTVVGVSLSFRSMSSGDTQNVLNGLGVALYTTVFGLSVHLYCGIFAAFFRYLSARLEGAIGLTMSVGEGPAPFVVVSDGGSS